MLLITILSFQEYIVFVKRNQIKPRGLIAGLLRFSDRERALSSRFKVRSTKTQILSLRRLSSRDHHPRTGADVKAHGRKGERNIYIYKKKDPATKMNHKSLCRWCICSCLDIMLIPICFLHLICKNHNSGWRGIRY